MNSVLTQEDLMSEIKEMLKDMENVKADVDIFDEMVKKQISQEAV